MKKFLTGFVILFVLMVSVPLATDAQTCRRNYSSRRYSRKNYRNVSRNNYRNYNRRNSYNRNGLSSREYVNDGPSFYRRHRNALNLGIGTGGGALIGALAGGRRGALIGTAIGAGSSALYTYVLNPKKRRYVRR